MDATANVNYSYDLYTRYRNNLWILPKIPCRSYKSVELRTVRTTTGRDTLKTKDHSGFAANIIKNSNPYDEILIVTFKTLTPTIQTYINNIKDRTIKVDNWGNLTGN